MSNYAQQIEFLISENEDAALGTATVYLAGTSTLATIWTTRDKSVVAANPYTLNANGSALLYADGVVKIDVKDSAGVSVPGFPRDNLSFGLQNGPWVDVAEYASLTAAIAAIGSTPTRLLIPTGTDTTLTANGTIPSTLTLLDGGGTINQGTYTLAINSPFDFALRQVFTGTGAIKLNKNESTYAEWFGVDGTADEVAINAAFTSLPDNGGTVWLMPTTYTIADSIVTRQCCKLIGVYGEPLIAGQTTTGLGTKILWAGTTGNMIEAFNVRLFSLNGVHLDGNGQAAVVGILLDSDNTPSGSQNSFERFSIRDCHIGVQWGTSGIGSGAYANDGTTFRQFTIWSEVAGSKGFVLNSGNAGQMSRIESGGIQTLDIGIDIVVANLLNINQVFGGGVMDTAFIQASVAIDVTINGCSSECWGIGKTWRTNRPKFLKVIAPAETYPVIESSITLVGNQINNPISVDYPVRITSVGDAWGYCKDYDTDADITCIGTFTDAESTGDKSRVLSLNNGVNPASIDLVTNIPAHGWVDSQYVNLENHAVGDGWITTAFDANNFTANGSMTWTLEAPDPETYCYVINNRTMTVAFSVKTSTVGGTLNNELRIAIPNGKVATKAMLNYAHIIENGTPALGICSVAASGTYISIQKYNLANFSAQSNLTTVQGQITFEVD